MSAHEVQSLTAQLKSTSKKLHKLSDVLVNARLVILVTDRLLYARALACFYYVFQALEAALEACEQQAAGRVLKHAPTKGPPSCPWANGLPGRPNTSPTAPGPKPENPQPRRPNSPNCFQAWTRSCKCSSVCTAPRLLKLTSSSSWGESG